MWSAGAPDVSVLSSQARPKLHFSSSLLHWAWAFSTEVGGATFRVFAASVQYWLQLWSLHVTAILHDVYRSGFFDGRIICLSLVLARSGADGHDTKIKVHQGCDPSFQQPWAFSLCEISKEIPVPRRAQHLCYARQSTIKSLFRHFQIQLSLLLKINKY